MCCMKPCLVSEWVNGVHGYRCLNCQVWRSG